MIRSFVRVAALLLLLASTSVFAQQIGPEKFADLALKLLDVDANLAQRTGGAFSIVIIAPQQAAGASLARAFAQKRLRSGRLQYSVHNIAAARLDDLANGRLQSEKIGAVVAMDLEPEAIETLSHITRTNQILSLATDRDDVDPLSVGIVMERGQVQIYRSDVALKAENVRLSPDMLALTRSRASSDYRENYREAIKAVDFKNWKEAKRRLHGALSENPKEGETVLIYGLRNEVYLPHYFLGVALFNLGNCESAVQEWNESERQGAIRNSREYRNISRYRQQCGEKKASSAEAPLSRSPS